MYLTIRLLKYYLFLLLILLIRDVNLYSDTMIRTSPVKIKKSSNNEKIFLEIYNSNFKDIYVINTLDKYSFIDLPVGNFEMIFYNEQFSIIKKRSINIVQQASNNDHTLQEPIDLDFFQNHNNPETIVNINNSDLLINDIILYMPITIYHNDIIYSNMKGPLSKHLLSKYNLYINESNSINILAELYTLVNHLNRFSKYFNLNIPAAIINITSNDIHSINNENGFYILNIPKSYFSETLLELNKVTDSLVNYKIDSVFHDYLREIYGYDLSINLIYDINFLTESNDSIIKDNTEALNHYGDVELSTLTQEQIRKVNDAILITGNITEHINTIKNVVISENPLFNYPDNIDIEYNKFIKSTLALSKNDFIDKIYQYDKLIYKILKNLYLRGNNKQDLWASISGWIYDDNLNKWVNNTIVLNSILNIKCQTPNDHLIAYLMYYIYNDSFPLNTSSNIIEFISTNFFISKDAHTLDSLIDEISIDLSTVELNTEIKVKIKLNAFKELNNIRSAEIILKNTLGENYVSPLLMNNNQDELHLTGNIQISNSGKSTSYYVDGLKIYGTTDLLYELDASNYILSFQPFSKIDDDKIPPSLVWNTFKVNLNELENFNKELEISFKVNENIAMNNDLNSFIYIQSPGNNPNFLELFGYGINEGETGYFTQNKMCRLKYTIPKYLKSGKYTIVNIELYDAADNVQRYNSSNEEFNSEIMNFEFISDYSDNTKPVVGNLYKTILIKSKPIGPNIENITPVIYMKTDDSESGVFQAIFTGKDTKENTSLYYSIKDNSYLSLLNQEDALIYNTAFPLNVENIQHNITLNSVIIQDNANNQTNLPINISLDNIKPPQNTGSRSLIIEWKFIDDNFGFHFYTSSEYNYTIESFNNNKWTEKINFEGLDAEYFYMDNIVRNNYELYRVNYSKKN